MRSSSTSTRYGTSSSVAERRVIINASPLIFLSRASRVDLLRVVADEVLVPAPVAEEVARRGPGDPSARAVSETGWLVVVQAAASDPRVLAWDLGPGESAVLTLALERPGLEVVIDDLAGRRCAQALGIPVRGTLGIVLLGKRRGLIEQARPVVDELRAMGMHLSDAVADRALALVDE